MGFIVDSLANIFLEALDTLIIWICDLSVEFNLDIGEPESQFYQTFLERSPEAQQTFTDFGFGIGALAMLIVLLVTIFKIYQLIADPFTQADSPGSIFIRFIFAGVGVVGSYEIFRYFEKGFNAAYQLFTGPYKSITKAFKQRNNYQLEKLNEYSDASQDSSSSWNSVKEGGTGFQNSLSGKTGNTGQEGDAFILGQDKLIPKEEAIASHGLALALIELVVGGALLLCLVKLIFEIYERYVIIAVLYIFSPLAFATIVSRQSSVFKNYIIMVASQFVLMCSNLVFLGVFMRAWYDILEYGAKHDCFFENSQAFITTMLLMIGWLIAGQKLDEHMRSLGLSAAQTGQGIMGAALGSMFLARAVVGGAIGAVGAGLGTTGKALTGQTGVQKAMQAGIDSNGEKGGLVGKLANKVNTNKSSASETKPALTPGPTPTPDNDKNNTKTNNNESPINTAGEEKAKATRGSAIVSAPGSPEVGSGGRGIDPVGASDIDTGGVDPVGASDIDTGGIDPGNASEAGGIDPVSENIDQSGNPLADITSDNSNNDNGYSSSSTGIANSFTGGSSFSDNLNSLADSENMNLTSAANATFGDEGSMSIYQDRNEDGRGVMIPDNEAGNQWMQANIARENLVKLGTSSGSTVMGAKFDKNTAPSELKTYLQKNETQKSIVKSNREKNEWIGKKS